MHIGPEVTTVICVEKLYTLWMGQSVHLMYRYALKIRPFASH